MHCAHNGRDGKLSLFLVLVYGLGLRDLILIRKLTRTQYSLSGISVLTNALVLDPAALKSVLVQLGFGYRLSTKIAATTNIKTVCCACEGDTRKPGTSGGWPVQIDWRII